jgi:hypothetical protein
LGQRRDFFLSASHDGEIPGESRQLAAGGTLEFFSRADGRRGKHVGIVCANGCLTIAKPLCIGNWIVGRKILPEIDAVRSLTRRWDESSGFSVHASAGIFAGDSPPVLAQWRQSAGTAKSAESNSVSGGADIPVCQWRHIFSGRQECLPHCGEKFPLRPLTHDLLGSA